MTLSLAERFGRSAERKRKRTKVSAPGTRGSEGAPTPFGGARTEITRSGLRAGRDTGVLKP